MIQHFLWPGHGPLHIVTKKFVIWNNSVFLKSMRSGLNSKTLKKEVAYFDQCEKGISECHYKTEKERLESDVLFTTINL